MCSFFWLSCAEFSLLTSSIPLPLPYCPWIFCDSWCFSQSSQCALFSGNSGSLPFDVCDPENFILKPLHPFSLQKTFARGEHHLSKSGNPSLEKSPLSDKWVAIFPWRDNKKAPHFTNIWRSHSNFLCSLNPPCRRTSFVKAFRSAHSFQLCWQ